MCSCAARLPATCCSHNVEPTPLSLPLPAGMSVGEGEEEDAAGWGEERDTQPTPLRRPERLDELAPAQPQPHQRAPAGVRGYDEEDEAAAWAQRRAAARTEAVVKKLQSQGAQVGAAGGLAGRRVGVCRMVWDRRNVCGDGYGLLSDGDKP